MGNNITYTLSKVLLRVLYNSEYFNHGRDLFNPPEHSYMYKPKNQTNNALIFFALSATSTRRYFHTTKWGPGSLTIHRVGSRARIFFSLFVTVCTFIKSLDINQNEIRIHIDCYTVWAIMETQPRKIFLVANAEQRAEQSADRFGGCREGLCRAAASPSLPWLLHPISHPPTASTSPKNPRTSAGFCPLPALPMGRHSRLFFGAELQSQTYN